MGYSDQPSYFIFAYGFIMSYEQAISLFNPERKRNLPESDYQTDEFLFTYDAIHKFLEEKFPSINMNAHLVGYEGTPGIVNNFFFYIKSDVSLKGEDLSHHEFIDMEKLKNLDSYSKESIDNMAKYCNTNIGWCTYVGNF